MSHVFRNILTEHLSNFACQVTTAVASATSETTAGPFSYFWNRSIKDPYTNCVNFLTNYANPVVTSTTASVSSTATSSSLCPEPDNRSGSSSSAPSTHTPCSSHNNSRQKEAEVATSSHQHKETVVPRTRHRQPQASSSTASLPHKQMKSPFGLDAIAIEMLVPSAVTPGIVTRGQGLKLKAGLRSGRRPLFDEGPELKSCGPTAFTGRLSKMKTLRKGGYV